MSGHEKDLMALPPGQNCSDCRSFARCRALIGSHNIHDQQTRCDWSPSRFSALNAEARQQAYWLHNPAQRARKP